MLEVRTNQLDVTGKVGCIKGWSILPGACNKNRASPSTKAHKAADAVLAPISEKSIQAGGCFFACGYVGLNLGDGLLSYTRGSGLAFSVPAVGLADKVGEGCHRFVAGFLDAWIANFSVSEDLETGVVSRDVEFSISPSNFAGYKTPSFGGGVWQGVTCTL